MREENEVDCFSDSEVDAIQAVREIRISDSKANQGPNLKKRKAFDFFLYFYHPYKLLYF